MRVTGRAILLKSRHSTDPVKAQNPLVRDAAFPQGHRSSVNSTVYGGKGTGDWHPVLKSHPKCPDFSRPVTQQQLCLYHQQNVKNLS